MFSHVVYTSDVKTKTLQFPVLIDQLSKETCTLSHNFIIIDQLHVSKKTCILSHVIITIDQLHVSKETCTLSHVALHQTSYVCQRKHVLYHMLSLQQTSYMCQRKHVLYHMLPYIRLVTCVKGNMYFITCCHYNRDCSYMCQRKHILYHICWHCNSLVLILQCSQQFLVIDANKDGIISYDQYSQFYMAFNAVKVN